VVSGTPAISHRLRLKTVAMIARLPQFSDRLRNLEKKVQQLEGCLEKQDEMGVLKTRDESGKE